MGTHPIFESDFDCLTEMDGEENNEDVSLSGTPGHSTISDTITVEELDRRQYENDLELVRIELESKKLQLESQKHDFVEQIELLEEKAEGIIWKISISRRTERNCAATKNSRSY